MEVERLQKGTSDRDAAVAALTNQLAQEREKLEALGLPADAPSDKDAERGPCAALEAVGATCRT